MIDAERRVGMLADYIDSADLKPCRHESELHDLVEKALRTIPGLSVGREVSLDSESRIDLMVGPVGVEIKAAGSQNEVLRQLLRYAQHERIEGLVLVTSRNNHRSIPATLNGKPVRVVWVTSWKS